jgi:hypothetical protein
MQDLTFIIGMDHDPADLWSVLGDVGIRMEAACAFPRLGGHIVHVVVTDEDAPSAQEALNDAGYLQLDKRPVIIAEIEPVAGELGRLARRVSDAGARIYILYMALGNRVVIGTDDLEAARAALG